MLTEGSVPGDILMVRRQLPAGGGGICALKVAGKRCGQVVRGWEASRHPSWREQQGESGGGGDNIRSGGREEDFVHGLDLGQALNARQKGLESMLRDRRSIEDP